LRMTKRQIKKQKKIKKIKKVTKKAKLIKLIEIKKRLRKVKRKYWIGLGIVGIGVGVLVWLFWGIPLPSKLGSSHVPISTKLFDRGGKLIYEIYADKRSSPITLPDVPKHVIDATIAIEDKNFYKHQGFDFWGMVRGLSRQFTRGRAQGGSTLTQQLVKNTLLSSERTVRRKIRELVLSLVVEIIYSKDEILEMYLNQIPYGSTAYGIEAASELYFGKNAKDLTLGEAALLAGLTQAPSKYSPFGSRPEYAKQRQEVVLARMVEDGYISQEEADDAKVQELVYSEVETFNAPHFALWVKEQLSEEYGEAVVEQGGLRVTTTLDLELQQVAEESVTEEVEELSDNNVGNGAALVTKPSTGEILAMVGSKDYFAEDEDGKVNIIFANRQPGSSIKPLNYALALRDGKITLASPLADVPTCFIVAGQAAYCPQNYDGGFHGAVQARFALGNSYNIPAVRVLALNGLENFVEFANQMGITTFSDPSNYGLSLTLGGGEVRPYDMAVAFGVFANGGIKQPLVSILKVEDYTGKLLKETNLRELEGDRIIPTEVAFLISHTLHDNNARSAAFGASSQLNVRGHPEVSVKTGTTNDLRDNWTIGYTKHALALAWVGNNDNSPMSRAVSGVSGASPIWNSIMRATLDKVEGEDGHGWPLQPDGVVGASVCWVNGALAPNQEGDPGCVARFEYFLKDYLPEARGETRTDVPIDKTTGEIGRPDTPPENIEIQNRLILYDAVGSIVCLDCTMPTKSINVVYPVSQN